ncbi:glycosyltransferase family 2 protein [Listeria sp. PSOL-1]|uniref:glycosyltransferase family 2 protein n=1 Tax=Listeria sp. PSOL-1 TaxID=1844999 RepID=UPI0013D4075A|nr:glycosyltransferase family 2 protein [Listeria sp. PSOL-1]
MNLSVIVPCFNEEDAIPIFFDEVENIKEQLPVSVDYIFINDGSTDNTLTVLQQLSKENSHVHYCSFSRNFGKEAALYAGLLKAKGDLVTVMDVDLQDPPELLIEMYEKIQDKNIDCVATRRSTRTGEPKIRSFFARMFYKIINRIGHAEMIDGARDFRLMTRQMVDAILEVTEYNRFSKGIFSWVGFNTIYISYENRERVAGETSWSFWKLFSYSIDGLVNFSEAPLNFASVLGAVSFISSLVAFLFIIIRTLVFGDPTSGWPSLVAIILAVGGIQLLSIGIIGKYIAKIFLETKRRPNFIIREESNKKSS